MCGTIERNLASRIADKDSLPTERDKITTVVVLGRSTFAMTAGHMCSVRDSWSCPSIALVNVLENIGDYFAG